ncbi:LLM class flavin-dependent oxidoreductase [Actinoallomurus liliacearum]|uniref:LLM class flavin-dependent oxidoreductase n=1 Tax=Actinoallomurus liliacearum TaxID=1080073 RepID=UPI0031EF2850
MRLGAIIEWTEDLPAFRGLMRLADELGYDVLGVGDSPFRAQELFVSMTTAAQEVRNATLATTVTTPIIRHPTITACGVSSLHELTGGRVVLGIGNGGSAMRALGRTKGSTRQEVREFVTAVRAILGGGSAYVDGYHTEPLGRSYAVPIFIAADHPKSLRQAGEIADGVIMAVGMSVEHVEEKIAIVRAAATEAGRDPDAIDIWGFTFASIEDDRAQAIAAIGPSLASIAGWRLRPAHMRAKLPPALLGAVEEMERRYDPSDFVVGGKNVRLLERLGLVDLAAGIGATVGDVAETEAHLKRLESIGVSCVLATLPSHLDPAGTLRRFARAGALRAAAGAEPPADGVRGPTLA